MNMEYFREFRTLADTRNYIQAADQLGMAQSTLSRHINTMEEELGVSLFVRTTRRVSLTKAGEALLPFACSIASLEYEYAAALLPFAKGARPSLSVGAVPMMPYYGLSDLLFCYRKAYPDFALQLKEDAPSALYEQLRTRKCDYAFILESAHPNPEFARMPFLHDSMVVMLPKGHPLSRKAHIRLEQLTSEHILALSDYTLAYQITQRLLAGLTPCPTVVCAGVRMEGIAARVAQKEGVCLATRQAALYAQCPDIVLVELAPRVAVNLNLVFRRGENALPASRHFLDYVSHARTAPPQG